MRNHLRQVRKARGLALWALATRTGSSATMLSAIERHGYTPTSPVRDRIARALRVATAAIWPDEAGPLRAGHSTARSTDAKDSNRQNSSC